MEKDISIEKRDTYILNFSSIIFHPTWLLNININEYILLLQLDYNIS